ncbi:uncharacterized protein EAF01_011422 [Botrytis porri]|uniref:uncharacterized protein n=1 Tax=Botrytis porri TaxID=87229 RepID=UPI0018FF1D6C|nr:uncharacterized protein EAF01_011422 [Botrytis porri]KAF7885357.1 hypothetical protein EAF01_011422 [Botrytis porri]
MFQQIVLRTNKKPGSQHGNLEKPSLSDQPPCNTDLGDDMISIQVGEGSRATEFMVPKGPSCRRVPFFNAMFNQGWLESATQSCTLPDDDPEAFSILMHWVFDVPHEAPVTFTLSGFQKHPETYINLAILAGKYLIDDLPDLIEARLIQKDLTRLNDPCYELPKSSWYRLAWELLPIVPILRKYYSTQKASHQFVYINGILVNPHTCHVPRKILREWEKMFAGRGNTSQALRKFRIFRYMEDRNSSGNEIPNLAWRYQDMCDYLDHISCSTTVSDEGFLRFFWRPVRMTRRNLLAWWSIPTNAYSSINRG